MGLDSVELVMAWEDAFEVKIPDAEAERMISVGDATDSISRLLDQAGRPRERASVFALVCTLTCDQLGCRLDQLSEGTRFVDDLGIS